MNFICFLHIFAITIIYKKIKQILIMKKSKLFYLVMGIALSISSCVDRNTPSGDGNDNTGNEVVLSPEQQMEKMREVATRALNTFQVEDQRDVLELTDYFVYTYDEYGWEDVKEHYKQDYALFRTLPNYIKRVASGNVTTSITTELYSFPKLAAIFEANEMTHMWEYKGQAGENEIIFRFKNPEGKSCEAKLMGEGSEFEFSATYETDSIIGQEWVESLGYGENQLIFVESYICEYYEYVNIYSEDGTYIETREFEPGEEVPDHYEYQWVQTDGYYIYEYMEQPFTAVLPSTIIFTIKEDNTEHIRLEADFDVQKGDHVKADVALQIANIQIAANTELTKTKASASTQINYGTQALLTASASLPACVLFDKSADLDWEDWIYEYDPYNEEAKVKYGNGIASLDIMGEIQLKVSTKDINQYFLSIENIDDKYDWNNHNNWWESPYYTLEYNKDYAALYNDNLECILYYNSDTKQAELQWVADSYETTVTNYETNTEETVTLYEYIPVLYFPSNETSYAFGEYFTEQSFGSIINLTETLINNYIKLAKYNEIEPIEF